MGRVYLIRHGKPAAVWGEADPDPGLDEIGAAQAEAAARTILALPVAERPTRVASSPLRRCHETALPLARALGVEVAIDPDVGEIPTPAHLAPEARGAWLRDSMAGEWSAIVGDIDYDVWRRRVAAAVAARPGWAIFSHFVAINGVISLVRGENQVVAFRPDHVSRTSLEVGEGGLSLIQLGPEAATRVN